MALCGESLIDYGQMPVKTGFNLTPEIARNRKKIIGIAKMLFI